MKYTVSVMINLSREQTLERLDVPENMKLWQPTLKDFELLDEDPKAAGARMRLVYDNNGRDFEMMETTVERSLPDSMTFTYETKGVWNQVVNRFVETGPGQTEWIQENEFRFRGVVALLGFLAPGMFRKQTLKTMNDFKEFAEGA